MQAEFKIEGLKELEQKLLKIEDITTSKRVMRRALKAALKPVHDKARALVPVESGGLRKSIRMAVSFRSKNKKYITSGIRMSQTKANPDGWKWPLIEFGTYASRVVPPPLHPKAQARRAKRLQKRGGKDARGARAKPFLRPAWDAEHGKMPGLFRDVLKQELDKVTKGGK